MSTILTETIDNVRILTLNRPEKLNAANLELQQTLLLELKAVAADKTARVLILTGAGRAFSAGGDRDILRDMASGQNHAQGELARVHLDTIHTLLKLDIPAIAAVSGPAVGYAAGLVALCDLVVMGEKGFLCDPHVTFGIGANSATQIVWPRLCSELVARELLMSGRKVYADEALRLGLCNRTCAEGKERETALQLAELFLPLPATGIAATKRKLNAPLLAAHALLETTAE
jgi:enoyl-CoA hydratase